MAFGERETSVVETAGSTLGNDHSSWSNFVSELFPAFFKIHPTRATDAGLHEYDGLLEDFTEDGIDREIAFCEAFFRRLREFDTESWPLRSRQDRVLIALTLKSTLHQLQQIKNWEKDPDFYPSSICQSAFALVARNFAPLHERLECLIQREMRMPAVLAAGKNNLLRPPLVFTEIALEQLPGTIAFFQDDLPKAFSEVKNQSLLSDFERANLRVLEALQEFELFVKQEVHPRSDGDFRIGAENYARQLFLEEMISTPLDELLHNGIENTRRDQQELRRIAHRIDPSRSPEELIRNISAAYPEPDLLVAAFRRELSKLQQFIVDRDILSLPCMALPIVTETPPFLRALTYASMDTPGPFDSEESESFFNITLPEEDLTADQKHSFMERFNRGTIVSTAIHEVLPGHYAQSLWLANAPSDVRKVLGCDSNSEGWAHYCEEMMINEGYGGGDPILKLGQLQDALLRDVRYVVSISMHTSELSFEKAVDLFQSHAYLSRPDAEMEVRRGATEPMYLVYTLGKLEILKLRDEFKTRTGNQYAPKHFHDSFLEEGFPPLPLVREALTGKSPGEDAHIFD